MRSANKSTMHMVFPHAMGSADRTHPIAGDSSAKNVIEVDCESAAPLSPNKKTALIVVSPPREEIPPAQPEPTNEARATMQPFFASRAQAAQRR